MVRGASLDAYVLIGREGSIFWRWEDSINDLYFFYRSTFDLMFSRFFNVFALMP